MITKSEIRSGAYFDSVVLMQLQRSLTEIDGVDDAGVVMATPANLELLANADLLTKDGELAKPDDLLIVVRAKDEAVATGAISKVDELMKRKHSQSNLEFRPKSLSAAAKQLPQAKWVLISVPGRYAAAVAKEALDLNKHVFLYSDNVSIEDELSLKKAALEKGLLMMGPDCGTAIINGVGLGFANNVQKGVIGIIGASGTGLQSISSHIHNQGHGVSHAIGVGGRDLKSEIGAITTLQALNILANDDETEVIVIVSKPPSAKIVATLLNSARMVEKPIVINFLGYPAPSKSQGNLYYASSLTEAAEIAIQLEASKKNKNPPARKKRTGYLRGLFSGGTLAYEAMLGFQTSLEPLFSNVPIYPYQKLDNPLKSSSHTIVDLGEDIFTVGRLHPMIDNDLRIRRMQQEAEDEETSIILFDVVLGEGSHPDPASQLTVAITEVQKVRPDIEFVALIIGTDQDPQQIDEQIEHFEKVDVKVFRLITKVVEYISNQFRNGSAPPNKPVDIKDLQSPFTAINVGLESFHDSLLKQEANAVQVDWRPPAGGDEKLMDILAKMRN